MLPIITVENLSKRYLVGHQHAKTERYQTLRDVIGRSAREYFRKAGDFLRGRQIVQGEEIEEFWALRDVSFELRQGDVLGVIGRNGAGKSTLLKVLSRITEPTRGRVTLKGRVASLLEVGTGFHPELTGRENIFLNGAILGMTKAEIRARFDEIVAFADVERFLDTPVKRYSSGMYVRLAFAVAAHLESEILIVDEVLAVGDAAFQKQCFGRMSNAAGMGRTVLLVSHNLQVVSTLASRVVLLDRGKITFDGVPQAAIERYLAEICEPGLGYEAEADPERPRIVKIDVATSDPANVHRHGEPFEVTFEIDSPHAIDGASLSFQAVNEIGVPVLHLWVFDSQQAFCRKPGRYRAICRIPKLRLYMGHYSITVYFTERSGGEKFETIRQVCNFEVVMHGKKRDFEWVSGTCAYLEDAEWTISLKE